MAGRGMGVNGKKENYLYGSAVLAGGVLAVKLIGAFFKIPLTNLLGGVGMSCFNVAYDLYYPLYALFISGVPVAVSKLVSENMARGRVRDARKLLRIALMMFLLVGVAGTLVMYGGAAWFTDVVKNPDARFAVRTLSPALFFGCTTAALRGYWQGMSDMRPTAVSQIVEAFAKLVLGLGVAWLVTSAGLREFAASGTAFGIRCPAIEQARLTILPYAAAGAIFGVTCSSVCGALYLVWRHKCGASVITPESWKNAPKASGSGELARRLVRLAIPVCVASVISNLTTFIDLISVMNRLTHAISRYPEQMLALYHDALPAGIGVDRLASYLYGCYSGMAIPLYNLVPALVTAISVSLLPSVSASWAVGNRKALERDAVSALRVTSMMAFPAGFGLCALAEPLMKLLYFSRPMEVQAIYSVLRIMGISSILVSLTLPLHAILQATGRAALPVRLLLCGGVVKLVCNYLLVGVVQLNIHAAPAGTLACYLLVFSASLCAVVEDGKLSLPIMDTFGKPMLAAAGCALSAWGTWHMLSPMLGESAATLLGICFGGIIYIILLFLMKAVQKTDILLLPSGEKFTKILEKHRLLG